MFASSLWWNADHSAFKDLQQRLLHSFAGNVAGDGDVGRFAGNFINFVNIDDTALCTFEVEVEGFGAVNMVWRCCSRAGLVELLL